MKRVRLYTVAPTIPEPLRFLEVLAHNLWWCWNPDAIELFRRIDPDLWKTCGRNPMLFLRRVKTDLLTLQTQDKAFLAYFSLEYGIHESVRCIPAASACWRATT
jgi:glycogen phosphorylase